MKVLGSKKGFTLTETIIAIAVVVIYSIATLSVCSASTKIFASSTTQQKLLRELEVYQTCFYCEDYVQATFFARGVTLNAVGQTIVYYDGQICVTNSENGAYLVTINITNDGSVRTFSASFGPVGGKTSYTMPKGISLEVSS